jgi:hypothetical protein
MLRAGKKIIDIAKILEIDDENLLRKLQDDANGTPLLELYKKTESALIKKACGGTRVEIVKRYFPKVDEDGQQESDDNGQPILELKEVIEKTYEVEPDATAIKLFLIANGNSYNPDSKNTDLIDNQEAAFDRFEIAKDEAINELTDDMSAESIDTNLEVS